MQIIEITLFMRTNIFSILVKPFNKRSNKIYVFNVSTFRVSKY